MLIEDADIHTLLVFTAVTRTNIFLRIWAASLRRSQKSSCEQGQRATITGDPSLNRPVPVKAK